MIPSIRFGISTLLVLWLVSSCATTHPLNERPRPLAGLGVTEGDLVCVARLSQGFAGPTEGYPATIVHRRITWTGQIADGGGQRPFVWSLIWRYPPGTELLAHRSAPQFEEVVAPSTPWKGTWLPWPWANLQGRRDLPFTVGRITVGGRALEVLATREIPESESWLRRVTLGFLFYPIVWFFGDPFVPGTVPNPLGQLTGGQVYQVVDSSGQVWAEVTALPLPWNQPRDHGSPWGRFRVYSSVPPDLVPEVRALAGTLPVLTEALLFERNFEFSGNRRRIPDDGR